MDGVRSLVGSPVSALIPFMGAPLLWPKHPQQAPPPNTITFGVRIPTREFCRDTNIQTVLLSFSCSVVTDSLRPHGLQHATLPCPSSSPRVCPSSCPLSQWCLPSISSSVVPFSSCPQSFPASGSFPVSWLFASAGQSIGASASASVLPVTGVSSLQSQGLSRVFSSTTVWKHQLFSSQALVLHKHNYISVSKNVIESLNTGEKYSSREGVRLQPSLANAVTCGLLLIFLLGPQT